MHLIIHHFLSYRVFLFLSLQCLLREMSQKEERKRSLILLAEKLEKELQSNETCIKIEMEKINENWKMLNDELRATVEFLEILFAEIKSKDFERKFLEIEYDIDEIETSLSRSCCEGAIQGTDDIKCILNSFEVKCLHKHF